MKKPLLIILVTALAMGVLCMFASGCDDTEKTNTTAYKIDAVLDTESMTVTAEESLTFVSDYETELDSLYFHLYPAAFREGARYSPVEDRKISEAYPKGVDYGGITVSSVTMGGEACAWEIGGEDEDILMITGLALMTGDTADVNISFTLDIPQIRHRFGYHDGVVNLGNWYPVLCVYEEGAWRTDPYYSSGDPFYSDIADYSVSLTAPTGWNVAGTGKVNTSINGETTTTSFTASGVRDFAMSASDKFTCAESEVNGVTVRYYYKSDANAEKHLKTCTDALTTFSELFGDYAYPTLSVVLTPFLYGGMEYPQLVYVSDSLNESLLEEAIVHEIAHQWWYAAVGNDQISEAWMDEGLAEYSVTLFYEKNPDYGIDVTDRIADVMQSYVLFTEMYSELIGGDTSMNRKLCDYFSSTDYSFHTYVKGALLFDSVRHSVGDDKFFAALKSYYKDYSGSIATGDDLIACFENASGINLKSYFDNWVDGTVGLY